MTSAVYGRYTRAVRHETLEPSGGRADERPAARVHAADDNRLDFCHLSQRSVDEEKKITWDDLAEAPWILNQEGCQYRNYIKRRFAERGQPIRVEVEVIGLELQKKLSQLGLGVALLPKPFVTTEIQRGSLKQLHIGGTHIRTHSCLVFRSDKYINGPVKSFLRLLEKSFGPAMKDLRRYFQAN